MVTPSKRVKAVLPSTKIDIIREAEKGAKQVELARKYTVAPQTLSNILQQKLKLLAAWEKGLVKKKSSKQSEINIHLLRF